MCGRYTLANPDPKRLRLRFGLAESVRIEDEPRFNIAPTDPVLAVRADDDCDGRDGRDLGHLRWGLVPGRWALEQKGRPLINARAESVATQPAQQRPLLPIAPPLKPAGSHRPHPIPSSPSRPTRSSARLP